MESKFNEIRKLAMERCEDQVVFSLEMHTRVPGTQRLAVTLLRREQLATDCPLDQVRSLVEDILGGTAPVAVEDVMGYWPGYVAGQLPRTCMRAAR